MPVLSLPFKNILAIAIFINIVDVQKAYPDLEPFWMFSCMILKKRKQNESSKWLPLVELSYLYVCLELEL